LSLEAESRLQNALADLAAANVLSSARDIGSGGFAVSLAQACIGGEIGALIRIGSANPQVAAVPWEMLFTEPASATIVSLGREKIAALKASAERHALFLLEIGGVGGGALEVSIDGVSVLSAWVEEDLNTVWSSALESQLTDEVVA
jgi:phosphoribosylformylglycinamidine synthase